MVGQYSIKEVESKEAPAQRNGADILVAALKEENVEVIFGYPGGAVLYLYDSLYDSGIPHILTRHEQGAIHAAEGYARVTGKPGVVIATSGPGATNLITGLTDAMIDSLPLVVITGQVGTSVMGTDAFQEAPIFSMTMPVTKYNYQVRTVEELPRVVKEAFHIATTGRPGPVLIDLPKDITAKTAGVIEEVHISLPGYNPTYTPNMLQIHKIVQSLRKAKKPVILAGAGVLHARASDKLLQFAERVGVPVVHTLLGLGGMPADHPLFLGMGGMHGTYAANRALYECDLLINIGARFDDRLTGNPDYFAKNAKVVHIDIDPAEIGKIIPTDIPVVGDAGETLNILLNEDLKRCEIDEWLHYLNGLKKEYPLWYKHEEGVLKPQRLIEMIYELTKGDAIITTDVGQHQMWTAQYYPFKSPHKWVTSGGLGTMGFGFPASIGAQVANRDERVIAIVGDGGFQMTLQELAVVKEYNLPIKIIIVNNYALGMVRQWQELLYRERYSESLIPTQPDFVKLAESYGIEGLMVKTEEEAYQALQNHLFHDRPVLIDCRVHPFENVFPMIYPGRGIHQMEGVKP